MRGKLNLGDPDYQEILRLFADREKIRFKDFVGELVKPDPSAKYRGRGLGPLRSVTKLQYKLKDLINWGVLENHKLSRREGYYTLSDEYKIEALRSFDSALIESFARDEISARIDIPFYELFNMDIEGLEKIKTSLPEEKQNGINKHISFLKRERTSDLTKTLYGFEEGIFTEEEKRGLSSKLDKVNMYISKLRRKAYDRLLKKIDRIISSEISKLELPKISKDIISKYLDSFQEEFNKSRKEFQKKKSIEFIAVEYTNYYPEFKAYFREKLEKGEINFLPLFKPLFEKYLPEKALKEEEKILFYIEKYIKKIFQAYDKYVEWTRYVVVLKPHRIQLPKKAEDQIKLIRGDLPTSPTSIEDPSRNTS